MARAVYVEGIGLWSPRLPGWPLARRVLRGEAEPSPAVARPAPAILAPTERRRAPDSVAVALEVAAAACADAERDPRTLPSVFASTYGDLSVSHQMCETLAQSPELTSPTKFHNSVHNAAAGYWAIAAGCLEPYTALAAHECTFASGLLTAIAHAHAEDTPVLYVAYDTEPRGPIATMASTRGVLGLALVLAPAPGARRQARLTWQVTGGALAPSRPRAANAGHVAGHALEQSLVLFEGLADAAARNLVLPLSTNLALAVTIEPE